MRAFSLILRITVIASLTTATLLSLISTASPRDDHVSEALVARVTISDVRPFNGVTHVVDRMLLPK